jgi:hypothetical protein
MNRSIQTSPWALVIHSSHSGWAHFLLYCKSWATPCELDLGQFLLLGLGVILQGQRSKTKHANLWSNWTGLIIPHLEHSWFSSVIVAGHTSYYTARAELLHVGLIGEPRTLALAFWSVLVSHGGGLRNLQGLAMWMFIDYFSWECSRWPTEIAESHSDGSLGCWGRTWSWDTWNTILVVSHVG